MPSRLPRTRSTRRPRTRPFTALAPAALASITSTLPGCGDSDSHTTVEGDAALREAARVTAEERIATRYDAEPAVAAACAAADILAFDPLASRGDDTAMFITLRRIHDEARRSDDPLLANRARDALAAFGQDRGQAAGSHLRSIEIVCDHYRG